MVTVRVSWWPAFNFGAKCKVNFVCGSARGQLPSLNFLSLSLSVRAGNILKLIPLLLVSLFHLPPAPAKFLDFSTSREIKREGKERNSSFAETRQSQKHFPYSPLQILGRSTLDHFPGRVIFIPLLLSNLFIPLFRSILLRTPLSPFPPTTVIGTFGEISRRSIWAWNPTPKNGSSPEFRYDLL